MSSQFDSFFGSDRTGSVTPPPGSKEVTQCRPPPTWPMHGRPPARFSAEAEKDTSQPWENPDTGTRGTVTPVASAYTQDGQTCRNFLASFVTGSSQAWVQGEACKQQQGVWEVRTLKPWKQS